MQTPPGAIGSGSGYSITPPTLNTRCWEAGGDADGDACKEAAEEADGDADDRTAGPFAVQPTASSRRIGSAARISVETLRQPGNYAPFYTDQRWR
jgi:hypothetical protein